MYIYICIYINLPVNVIARLRHRRSGDSQGQETFLTASTDKQTRNYDTECSNHHPSLSTLSSKDQITGRERKRDWVRQRRFPMKP